jgi:hypothetical protein
MAYFRQNNIQEDVKFSGWRPKDDGIGMSDEYDVVRIKRI